MSTFVESQLEIYQTATSNVESWKADHDEVMANRLADEVEDLVQFSNGIYEFLNNRNARLRLITSEIGLQFCKAWTVWIELSERLVTLVDRLETEGFLIKQSNLLKNCLNDAISLKSTFGTIENSLQQATSGRTKKLGSAFHELRSRNHG